VHIIQDVKERFQITDCSLAVGRRCREGVHELLNVLDSAGDIEFGQIGNQMRPSSCHIGKILAAVLNISCITNETLCKASEEMSRSSNTQLESIRPQQNDADRTPESLATLVAIWGSECTILASTLESVND